MPEKSVVFFENKHYPKAKRGSDFKQDFDFPQQGVAFFEGNVFFAYSLNVGGGVHYAQVASVSLDALKKWVLESFGDPNPIESDYMPGTVYKRIYRPTVAGSFARASSQEKSTESFISLRILLEKLEQLFETIEPTEANLPAYGLKIREILLLACMEVESSLAAVLRENGYPASAAWSTNDYVKLFVPMVLDSYKLSLRSYPRLPSFTPFENWDMKNPTQSLTWYDAYNKTKHDREENLKLATLHNAIQAVGAVVVMFYAQFGFSMGTMWYSDPKNVQIRNIFNVITDFNKHWQECYIPTLTVVVGAQPNPLPSFDWNAINYPF